MRFRPSTGQSIGTTATGSEEEMGKLVVSEFVTLDGVIEDPGGAEGFDRGGWALSFDRGADGDAFKFEELMSAEAMLLGRVTYEGFAAAWPDRTDEAGFADKMNSMPKYVVSSTLHDPAWRNSTVIAGDVAQSIATLKGQLDGDLLVAGSARLVEALVEHELVDELRLMVFPVVLGAGKRLFGDSSRPRPFTVVASKPAGATVLLTLISRAP
jgi:dihydrofolate reductase